MASVQKNLEQKLKLKVNQDKSQVAKTGQTNFLGFTFRGNKIQWSDKAFREFKRRVKELTGKSLFVYMEYRLEKPAQYLRGWMNYFGISGYYRPLPKIDHWLRRRVRICYWKQWGRFQARVRNLLKLGTLPGVAIPMCFSPKDPCRCARTLATQTGMTNQWLMDQGLLSVKELWVNIHYPTTVR
jgi:RNA-directed DNA polymerase